MKALADALVYAATYIDLRPDEGEEFLDNDVAALESIASCLGDATDAELDALAAAAERALAQELAGAQPRERFVESYSRFMESFLDGWTGNQRLPEQ